MRERTRPRLQTLLARREIYGSKPSTDLVINELDLATSDLETAKQSFQNDGYKWATIQAYHSMLHASRALLYRLDYRERSHRGLLEALYQLYERGVIDEMLEDFSDAMNLTEKLHDGQPSSQSSTRKVLENATEYLEQSARILAAPREWFEKHPPQRRRKRSR